jgi:hypothetical protein
MTKEIEWRKFPASGFDHTIPVTDHDVETMRGLFPGCDPENPPWDKVEAELVAAGYSSVHDLTCKTCRRLVHMLAEVRAAQKPQQSPVDCYVTLLQMAAIVQRDKKTLRRLGTLPAPAIKGGKGKSDEWKWDDVRPILEKEYRKELPVVFPADRFVRS